MKKIIILLILILIVFFGLKYKNQSELIDQDITQESKNELNKNIKNQELIKKTIEDKLKEVSKNPIINNGNHRNFHNKQDQHQNDSNNQDNQTQPDDQTVSDEIYWNNDENDTANNDQSQSDNSMQTAGNNVDNPSFFPNPNLPRPTQGGKEPVIQSNEQLSSENN